MCELDVWNESSDQYWIHKARRIVFTSGTLIVFIQYDISSISKLSLLPTPATRVY